MVYERIERILKERGISKSELARSAGSNISTLYGLRKGAPNSFTIHKFARALGVHPSELSGEKEATASERSKAFDDWLKHHGKALGLSATEERLLANLRLEEPITPEFFNAVLSAYRLARKR